LRRKLLPVLGIAVVAALAGAGAAAAAGAFSAQTAAPAVDIVIARAIAKALRITFSIPVSG
jgi:hypothetical protein